MGASSAAVRCQHCQQIVLRWFQTEYLPFRQWQAISCGRRSSRRNSSCSHTTLRAWYLQQYSAALSGGKLREHLSFVRSAALASSEPNAVTLLIVLDGLHVADARHLQLALQSRTNRLTQIVDGLAFAPVPTITHFCKPALFRGVQPDQVDEVSDIGIVLPERNSPVEQLKHAHPGDLFLWRVLEPDHTYHQRNNYDTLRRLVEGQLDTIASNIADIVERGSRLIFVCGSSLRPIMGGCSPIRNAPRPPPMAWKCMAGRPGGACDKDLSDGYCVENNIAYLHHGSFGLPADTAVLLDESAFTTKDGKGGSEQFPHGGFSPRKSLFLGLSMNATLLHLCWTSSFPVKDKPASRERSKSALSTRAMSALYCSPLSLLPQTTCRRCVSTGRWRPGSGISRAPHWQIWPSQHQLKSMQATVYARLNNGLAFEFMPS